MIVKAPMRSWGDTLHLGDDPHEPGLHGPAPGGGAGDLLLPCPVVRPGAGALPAAGHDRAGAGEGAGVQ